MLSWAQASRVTSRSIPLLLTLLGLWNKSRLLWNSFSYAIWVPGEQHVVSLHSREDRHFYSRYLQNRPRQNHLYLIWGWTVPLIINHLLWLTPKCYNNVQLGVRVYYLIDETTRHHWHWQLKKEKSFYESWLPHYRVILLVVLKATFPINTC